MAHDSTPLLSSEEYGSLPLIPKQGAEWDESKHPRQDDGIN